MKTKKKRKKCLQAYYEDLYQFQYVIVDVLIE